MNFIDPTVDAFLHALQRSTDPVLLDMEARAEREKFPIIGPLVGRLCRQIAMTIGARDVFEMGSGFGYSTYFFAQAVGESGRVVHTDGDAKKSADARKYLGQAGLAARVSFEVGDAIDLLESYPGPFDVVFIDLDKHQYPAALELARSRVREGGYIITDNVLWSGRVAQPAEAQDQDTRAINAYLKAAFDAPELHTVIVPIRDGVALSYHVPQATRAKKRG